MNYEQMSDGEITWRVHHAVNKIPDGYATICTADYCNNPSDAWPIIVENGISIQHGELVGVTPNWMATFWKTKGKVYPACIEVLDKNPLRAAMICFLKMKDAENETSN